jgi:hypothetical protein
MRHSVPGTCLACLCLLTALAGCGSGEGASDLARFAGWYDVTEAFASDTGVQCPPPQVEIIENSVEVRVDGNQFEARFSARWGDLLGEIRENGSFLSSGNLGPAQTLRFTGSFEEETVIGSLDDVRTGCTRTFGVNGTRRPIR